MIREIKFRALLNGIWYYSDSQESAKALGCKLGGSIAATFWERFYVGYDSLSQYTGLKDKKGKEIYEGDIVSNSRATFVIEWIEHLHAYWCKRTIGEGKFLYELSNVIKEKYSVIGTIYENPELLKP